MLTISGVIQGATNNALVIGNAPSAAVPGVVVISGTLNTYTGSTQVLRGVLKIGASNALPTGTTLDVDSSTAAEDSIFDLNGFNQTVAALTRSGSGSGTGGSFITNNGAMPSTLTVNQTGTFTYSGVIKDGASTVALTKSGPGLLTLSGTNTYTGATQITGGTLGLSGSLTGTPITVTAGALSETSTGRIGGSFGVTISSGTSTLAGTNTYSGSTTVNGAGATLNLSGFAHRHPHHRHCRRTERNLRRGDRRRLERHPQRRHGHPRRHEHLQRSDPRERHGSHPDP